MVTLTPETHERIISAVWNGHTNRDAAVLAGINESTLHDWIKRGEKTKNGRFLEFSKALKKEIIYYFTHGGLQNPAPFRAGLGQWQIEVTVAYGVISASQRDSVLQLPMAPLTLRKLRQ